MDSGHFIKSLEGYGQGHMILEHSLTVDCKTFINEETAVCVFPLTSVETEVTGSKATFTLSFPTLLLMYQMNKLRPAQE